MDIFSKRPKFSNKKSVNENGNEEDRGRVEQFSQDSNSLSANKYWLEQVRKNVFDFDKNNKDKLDQKKDSSHIDICSPVNIEQTYQNDELNHYMNNPHEISDDQSDIHQQDVFKAFSDNNLKIHQPHVFNQKDLQMNKSSGSKIKNDLVPNKAMSKSIDNDNGEFNKNENENDINIISDELKEKILAQTKPIDPLEYIKNFKSSQPLDTNYYKKKYGSKFTSKSKINKKKEKEKKKEEEAQSQEIEQIIHDSYNSISDMPENKSINRNIFNIINKYKTKDSVSRDEASQNISINKNITENLPKNKSLPPNQTPKQNIFNLMQKYKKNETTSTTKNHKTKKQAISKQPNPIKKNALKETLKIQMESKTVFNELETKNKFLKKQAPKKIKKNVIPDKPSKLQEKNDKSSKLQQKKSKIKKPDLSSSSSSFGKKLKNDVKKFKKFSKNISKKSIFKSPSLYDSTTNSQKS